MSAHALPGGVLRCESSALPRIASQLKNTGEGGIGAIALDLSGCADKPTLMARLTKAVRYPNAETFGANWDALSDVLTDLSWLGRDGWLLLIDATAMPADAGPGLLPTLLEIAEEAAAYWRAQGRLFQTLVAID